MRDIAIIGAGIAGLSTAKVLQEFGHRVRVYEKDDEVGGVWAASRRYPGLSTQNPRETYAFSDFPMPDHYPEWPSGAQMQAYLEAYVDRFALRSRIQLRTQVVRAEPDDRGWRLHVVGPEGERTDRCDYLIVCNGIFSVPSVPKWPGSEAFTAAGGRICHTSEFTDLEQARGRRVLVIGYGKSSCDAAMAIASVAQSTTVIARHLIWKIPKRIGGIVNFKHLFLTRMGEGLFRYRRVRGFERFLHGPGRPLRNAMLGTVQSIVQRQLGLERLGLHPRRPLETIARSTVSLVTDGFYEAIADQRITVVRDEIARLEPGRVHTKNSGTLSADLIVSGTGWDQTVPFLDVPLRERVTDAEGNFRLYRTMLPPHVPRLAFNGYNSSFFSQLNAEIGALWLAQYLRGGIQLPPVAEQDREISERLAWTAARTDGKHSKGTNIIPFSLHQIDELLEDLDLKLPPLTRLGQWLKAVDAADFAPLHRQLRERPLQITGMAQESL